MRRFFFSLAVLCGAVTASVVGCRHLDIEKNADGSWHAKCDSYFLFTSLGYLEVSVTTNGVANFRMNDFSSDVSTNSVLLVDSSGKVIAEVTGTVIERLVK